MTSDFTTSALRIQGKREASCWVETSACDRGSVGTTSGEVLPVNEKALRPAEKRQVASRRRITKGPNSQEVCEKKYLRAVQRETTRRGGWPHSDAHSLQRFPCPVWGEQGPGLGRSSTRRRRGRVLARGARPVHGSSNSPQWEGGSSEVLVDGQAGEQNVVYPHDGAQRSLRKEESSGACPSAHGAGGHGAE